MRITPLAVPESGPYRVSGVNQVTGKVTSTKFFADKAAAIEAAKAISLTGDAGTVYDAQGRCHEILVKESDETEKD